MSSGTLCPQASTSPNGCLESLHSKVAHKNKGIGSASGQCQDHRYGVQIHCVGIHPSRTVAEAMRVVVRLKNGPEIKDVLERVQVVQDPWSLGTTLSRSANNHLSFRRVGRQEQKQCEKQSSTWSSNRQQCVVMPVNEILQVQGGAVLHRDHKRLLEKLFGETRFSRLRWSLQSIHHVAPTGRRPAKGAN